MKTPEPLYPCAAAECAEFGPFRPEELCRSKTLGGWYCPDCFESRDELEGDQGGISLAAHLKQTTALVPRELDEEQRHEWKEVLDAAIYAETCDPVHQAFLWSEVVSNIEIKEKR